MKNDEKALDSLKKGDVANFKRYAEGYVLKGLQFKAALSYVMYENDWDTFKYIMTRHYKDVQAIRFDPIKVIVKSGNNEMYDWVANFLKDTKIANVDRAGFVESVEVYQFKLAAHIMSKKDFSAGNESYKAALRSAIEVGDLKFLKKIKAKKLSIDVYSYALDFAKKHKNEKIMDYLFRAVKPNQFSYEAILCGAQFGRLDWVELKIKPRTQDYIIEEAKSIAAKNQYNEILDYLNKYRQNLKIK